jgi:hypothetical protein
MPALCRMHPFEFSDSTHHSNEIGFKLSKDDKFEEEECLLCQNHFHSDDHKSAAEEMGEEYYDFLKFMEAYYYRILYFDSVKHEIKTMADVERIIKRPDFGKEIHILKEKHGKRAKK